eukprot:TRINITY_DN12651_c0_g1_i2.p1 TRINITY_DN12651_c0_g1~~TRINITY_DN12651_c0_g1_i2.p1  ORF type:complete len:498 (+),score=142.09 TRINITY_DN12651_c0_g1_i2:53-1495(+)
MADPSAVPDVPLSKLVHMSMGWIGIQFGWGLQLAYGSALFEYLGARPSDIALMWLPAPVSGLLVQPLAGHLSDRLWTRWGRRRPLFVTGACIGAVALMLLPRAPSLRVAGALVCLLDCAANIASVAFRALIGDMVPPRQQTRAFAVQSVMICVGALSATAFAWAVEALHGGKPEASEGRVPGPIVTAFHSGALIYIVSAAWTVSSVSEPAPSSAKTQVTSLSQVLRAPLYGLRNMPPTMRQLAPVHCLGHAGLYMFYLYLAPGVARVHFGAADEKDPRYTQGVEFAGLMISFYNMFAAPFSVVLPKFAGKVGRPAAHSCCLFVGGISLLLTRYAPSKTALLACMLGTGLAWAGILSLPFAILLACLPRESVGMYCGVNNLFVVLPEIMGSFVTGWLLEKVFGGNELSLVAVGGGFMLLGSALALRIDDVGAKGEGVHAMTGLQVDALRQASLSPQRKKASPHLRPRAAALDAPPDATVPI